MEALMDDSVVSFIVKLSLAALACYSVPTYISELFADFSTRSGRLLIVVNVIVAVPTGIFCAVSATATIARWTHLPEELVQVLAILVAILFIMLVLETVRLSWADRSRRRRGDVEPVSLTPQESFTRLLTLLGLTANTLALCLVALVFFLGR